jgi:hypothetical protein
MQTRDQSSSHNHRQRWRKALQDARPTPDRRSIPVGGRLLFADHRSLRMQDGARYGSQGSVLFMPSEMKGEGQ